MKYLMLMDNENRETFSEGIAGVRCHASVTYFPKGRYVFWPLLSHLLPMSLGSINLTNSCL